MVKLAFRPYGYEVHTALQSKGFAPKLLGRSQKQEIGADAIVMHYLSPPTANEPGWVTLHDLAFALVFQERAGIYEKLMEIVSLLKGLNLVHGDLRPNNLMIKVAEGGGALVQPITVNAIDMEWAGRVSEAYYPADRNETVGYPGDAAGPIRADDDCHMIQCWWNKIRVNKL